MLAALFLLSGCAANRQLSLGRPVGAATPLPLLAGTGSVDGDDYYVQFVSEFAYPEDAGKENCRDFGGSYAKGGSTSLLVFQVRNEARRFSRETPALAFESTAGRCSLSLDAKKVYLTPWMRLDLGQDARVDYTFASSDNGTLDLARIGKDMNTASNVLAVSGVGTGVALMGKIAANWMLNTGQAPAPSPTGQGQPQPEQVRRRQESRTLAPLVSLGPSATLNPAVFAVYERADNPLNPLSGEPKPVGELTVRAEVKTSLLLRTGAGGLPDARDLSLEELWRSSIQTGQGTVGLREFIAGSEHPELPKLQPDWGNYREVETACRKLKVALKDLGFNRFDRAAVLYYFLDQTPEWKNYNVAAPEVLSGAYPFGRLREFRGKGFGGCLSAEDYETMKAMGLPVNGGRDWAALLLPAQEKEAYFDAIRAVERPLAAALRNPGVSGMEHQLFPLLADGRGGAGKVLVQDRLGNFGLEQLLGTPAVPGEGVVASAGQVAALFAGLKISDLSCARPAFEQGRPVKNVAILVFTTAEGSPLAKGGALEFEFDGGRIVRLALQSPEFRDFRQDALGHPDLGDCRIDPALLQRL